MSTPEYPHALLGGSEPERDRFFELLLGQFAPDHMMALNLTGRLSDSRYERSVHTVNESIDIIRELSISGRRSEKHLLHIDDASLFVGNPKDSFTKNQAWNELTHLLRMGRSLNVMVVLSLPVSDFESVPSSSSFGYKLMAGSMEDAGGYGIPRKAPAYSPKADATWSEAVIGIGAGGKEVSVDFTMTPHWLIAGAVGSGKSVLTKMVIDQCLDTGWDVHAIDMKRQHLGNEGLAGISITLESAMETLRSVHDLMEERYAVLEKTGKNYFTEIADMKPVLVVVDEAYMLLAASGIKTEEGMTEDALRGEASKLLASIARLGRAAGIHLFLTTQRPDATVFYGEFRDNLGGRIFIGRADHIASNMVFGNDRGYDHLKDAPMGRGYIQTYGIGEEFQMYAGLRKDDDEWAPGQMVKTG